MGVTYRGVKIWVVDRYKGVLIQLDAKRHVFASLQMGRIFASLQNGRIFASFCKALEKWTPFASFCKALESLGHIYTPLCKVLDAYMRPCVKPWTCVKPW